MSEYQLNTKLRVLNEKQVLDSAQELGRIHGRDDDWSPATVQEALKELDELGEGRPVDNGYEVVSRHCLLT